MNRIILMGRLTKEPDVRYTQTGKVVVGFTLAVDRPFTGQNGQKETDFINCQMWGKQAETFGNSVNKGQRTLIEGRLQIRPYDAKDGSKRYAAEVVCDRFEYIEKKEQQGTQQNYQQNASRQNNSMDTFGSSIPFDEEIPF